MTLLHILKTNIDSELAFSRVKTVLTNHENIRDWSIDLEDIDNVLKVHASHHLDISDICELVRLRGYYCEDLDDSRAVPLSPHKD